MRDLADVLNRIQQVPLGTLVDELRALHEGSGVAARPSPPAALGGTTPAPPEMPRAATATGAGSGGTGVDPLAPVLELLRRASAAALATPPAQHPAASPAIPPSPPRERRYERLQRHFAEHESELRRHAHLTDRIVGQLARGELAVGATDAAPLQQEVRLLCTTGGTSAARFVLCNELGRDALVDLVARPLRDAALVDGLEVACAPAQVELAAGAEIVARVRVDLMRCPAACAGRTLELLVDAVVDGTVVQKIWVELVVRAAPSDDAGAAAR